MSGPLFLRLAKTKSLLIPDIILWGRVVNITYYI